jgi:hypothetical protein
VPGPERPARVEGAAAHSVVKERLLLLSLLCMKRP